MKKYKVTIAWLSIFSLTLQPLMAISQTLPPPPSPPPVIPLAIAVNPGDAICSGGSQNIPISITLPPSAVVSKVDVFFSFDDTGSFAGFVPTVRSIFSGLVSSLETALPAIEFGFGVGRFEDYGGPGASFSGETLTGRPFTLNQPIITATGVGGAAARDTLISSALARTTPGYGGDGPETAIAEGLYQIATGIGFDGDGNGSTLDSGPAGDPTTQTSPGTSGDVPAFASNAAPTSGTLGGAGWRSDALHLAIIATDICSVAAFPAGSPIPTTITGAGGKTEPTSAFACSATPGIDRFGFVSDSKSLAGNTVANAVVPAEAGTVQGTVSALNTLGIRVLGMGPGAAPTTSPGPSFDESVFLSALARLTGAVDSIGDPLVFSTSVPLATLSNAIADAITTTATEPVDITLATTPLPAGLSFGFAPAIVNDVAPGGMAPFMVTLTGSGSPISGSFDIQFQDVNSGAILGTIPVTVDCRVADTTPPVCQLVGVTPKTATTPTTLTVTVQDTESGLASVVPTANTVNATVDIPTFTVGTTDPQTVQAYKVDESQKARLELNVTNVAGLETSCDPVVSLTIRENGEPEAQTLGGIPQAENKVTVINGTPGVKNLDIVVNGKKFKVAGLGDGKEKTLDISSAMVEGDENSITLTAKGKPGGSATIVISD